MVTLVHPNLPEQEIRVQGRAVPTHERSGWRRKDTPNVQPPVGAEHEPPLDDEDDSED